MTQENELIERLTQITYPSPLGSGFMWSIPKDLAIKIVEVIESLGYRHIDTSKLTVLSDKEICKSNGCCNRVCPDYTCPYPDKRACPLLGAGKFSSQAQLAHTIKQIEGEA